MNQRIAIPTNEGKLWQHFGKAPQVTFFNVENGKIVDQQVLQRQSMSTVPCRGSWLNKVALMCFAVE